MMTIIPLVPSTPFYLSIHAPLPSLTFHLTIPFALLQFPRLVPSMAGETQVGKLNAKLTLSNPAPAVSSPISSIR